MTHFSRCRAGRTLRTTGATGSAPLGRRLSLPGKYHLSRPWINQRRNVLDVVDRLHCECSTSQSTADLKESLLAIKGDHKPNDSDDAKRQKDFTAQVIAGTVGAAVCLIVVLLYVCQLERRTDGDERFV